MTPSPLDAARPDLPPTGSAANGTANPRAVPAAQDAAASPRRRVLGTYPSPEPLNPGGGTGTRDGRPGGGAKPAAGPPPAQAPARGDANRTTAPLAGQEWTIELPAGLPLLSLNRRYHWAKHQAIGEGIRDAAIVLARKAKIPPLNRARIIAEYQPPTSRGRRDADNIPAPSAKWAVDGLVKAGVLPDDACPKYVEAIEGRVGEPYSRGRLRIIIREVPPPGGAV